MQALKHLANLIPSVHVVDGGSDFGVAMKVYGGTTRMRSVEVEYWAGEYAYQNLRVIDLSEIAAEGINSGLVSPSIFEEYLAM